MKAEKDFFDVLSDLDCNLSDLTNVLRLLQLFDETLWNEASILDPDKPWTTTQFKNRFDVIYSTLSVIYCRMADVLKSMTDNMSNGYDLHRKIKEAGE